MPLSNSSARIHLVSNLIHRVGPASSSTLAVEPTATKPLFRWAGGKQRVVDRLISYLPVDIEGRVYIEPFFGAGSLFFRLAPRRAIVADSNDQLMRAYAFVRDHPARVSTYLNKHMHFDCESYYYNVRDLYNRARWSAAQSARFIYLNRTCFNGIFRVNVSGEFNVPYGFKSNPTHPSHNDILAASRALRRTALRTGCFRDTLANLPPGAFVYLDPPYPPLNGTSFFTHYTKDRFTFSDQVALAEVLYRLDHRGIPFLMTNAETDDILRLYRRFQVHRVDRTRYITCKSVKHRVGEVVISNYRLPLTAEGLANGG